MRAHPHYNPFNVREPAEQPDWQKIFSSTDKLDLEIGFSNGTWLLGYAQKFPERNIIGIEIRKKFIAAVKDKLNLLDLKNAYVLQANANTSLEKLFKNIKLANVFIMFPDPWYKPRHIKRRVVNSDFLNNLANYLKPGGQLQIATDKLLLAQDMQTDLNNNQNFKNIFPGFAQQNIPELVTDIELYHLKRNNPIYRLVYERVI